LAGVWTTSVRPVCRTSIGVTSREPRFWELVDLEQGGVRTSAE
jgi:hypothetical protein